MNKTQGQSATMKITTTVFLIMVKLWYDFHIAHKFIAQLENLHGRKCC